MSFAKAKRIADAVLLEGYVLYPYRASSAKNRYRFTFGVLVPAAWAERGGERAAAEAAWLLERRSAKLEVRVRFLHHERRTIEAVVGAELVRVDSLDVGGELYLSFDEGIPVEREFSVALADLDAAGPAGLRLPFEVPGETTAERIRADGDVVGRVLRRRETVSGALTISLEPATGAADGPPLARLRLGLANETPCAVDASTRRDDVLPASLLSAQLLGRAPDGGFLSLLDPPAFAADAARDFCGDGLYSVLLGAPGESELVLAAPIALSDHPQVAPESPRDYFDVCEIDELLALRTRTLTDEEKRQARATDPRAAAIVDGSAALAEDELLALHGARRDRAAGEMVPRVPPVGSRVRLKQGSRRTDAQDFLYFGLTATVEKIEHDVDGDPLVAVILDDDPAAAENRATGRFHYYRIDEVEPVDAGPARTRVLVAGIGNLFLGDDGFGVEVARRLLTAPLPAGVEVGDYGIRGVHLAYRLLDAPDLLVLVDTIARGGPPGTVYVVEPDVEDVPGQPSDAAHALTPAAVFSAARALGATLPRVLLVAVEPQDLNEGMTLSRAVEDAIEPALSLIRNLIEEELGGHPCPVAPIETTPSR